MARLIYTGQSLDDLERMWAFLQGAAPEHANAAMGHILQALELLESHPLLGRRVSDGLRELVISRGATGHIALYDFDAARGIVHVLRLRHQREAGYLD